MDLLGAIVSAMLGVVPAELHGDLAAEPEDVIEAFLEPIGVRSLAASAMWTSIDCSCDGFYTTVLDPKQPWILYDDSVARPRQLFTLLHELGHHIIQTLAPRLLDDVDQLAGQRGDPVAIEEAVCHRFAGELLVPDSAVELAMQGATELLPSHVVALHAATSASWSCVAVRLAQRMERRGAVVLMGESGVVSFCASGGTLAESMWPRGSRVSPNGPLSRAFRVGLTARQDVYRWDLAYSTRLFCDTLLVDADLAIGVLSSSPSDGSLSLLAPDPEPKWKQVLEYCERCGDERDVSWCEKCRGRKCRTCWSCGCYIRPTERICTSCGLLKGLGAFQDRSDRCSDCE